MFSLALGLVLLRILLGLLLLGHSTQKLFGWFRGGGIYGTAVGFEKWGLRPGWIFVVIAGVGETIGALLIITGSLVPVAAAIIIASMIVAIAFNWPRGVWAHLGGYEVALVYAFIALVLAVIGPGEWSVDALIGLGLFHGPVWGAAALVAGALGAIGPILLRRRNVAMAAHE